MTAPQQRRDTRWRIAGTAVLTAVVAVVLYVALLVFLGPTGLFIAVAAWIVLTGCAATFVTNPARRTTGIGMLVGGLIAVAAAAVLIVLSS